MAEMMTLKEAATATGRSASTIRSWIKKGLLQAERASSKGNAPLVFTRAALVEAMQKLGLVEGGEVPAPAPTIPGQIPPGIQPTISPAPSPQISPPEAPPETSTERLISALEGERDRVVEELQEEKARVRHLEERLDQERERSRSLQERVVALERELASLGGSGRGIWGLLETGVRRVMGTG
jgi:hypothetical protein